MLLSRRMLPENTNTQTFVSVVHVQRMLRIWGERLSTTNACPIYSAGTIRLSLNQSALVAICPSTHSEVVCVVGHQWRTQFWPWKLAYHHNLHHGHQNGSDVDSCAGQCPMKLAVDKRPPKRSNTLSTQPQTCMMFTEMVFTFRCKWFKALMTPIFSSRWCAQLDDFVTFELASFPKSAHQCISKIHEASIGNI